MNVFHRIVLTSIFLLIASPSFAQLPSPGNLDWMTKWQKLQPTTFDESNPNSWMYGDRMYTGLAYDETRDVVFVVSPNGAQTRILTFDAETGTELNDVPVDNTIVYGGLESGKFALYKIAVDGDGRIYACNVIAPSADSTVPFKVYRWDTPTSNPQLVYQYTAPRSMELFGTSFAVSGKRHYIDNTWQDSARIYISTSALNENGTSDDELHILSINTSVNPLYEFELAQHIVNPNPSIRYFGSGVAPYNESATSDIYTCAPGKSVRRIRQFPIISTPPETRNVLVVDTIPYDMANVYFNASGALAVYVHQKEYNDHYIFIGTMVPYTLSGTNEYLYAGPNVVWRNGWNGHPGTWPGSSTPGLNISQPGQLTGTQNGIVDVDYKIFEPEAASKYEQLYYLASTGGIGCYLARTPLFVPVELTSFTATLAGSAVHLTWITASETNNYGFHIERNTGAAWETIGFVQGQGTTTQQGNYSFTDPLSLTHEQAGVAQYRLKQVDFDGTFEYSPIVQVTVSTATSIRLHQNYPNPFTESTQIQYYTPSSQPVTLTVYNTLGQLVWSVSNRSVQRINEITISGLARGVYRYVLATQTDILSRQMIVAQ